jgi:hypothetical protein
MTPYPDSEYPSVVRGKDKRESQRLLAAAPEMLEALRELRDELNSWVWQGSVFGVTAGYHRYIEGMVSKAISKAEGRSE